MKKTPTITLGRDTNGNRIVKVRIPGERGFSLQTNGLLPLTHRDGVSAATFGEVRAYVGQHGTAHQRVALGL